MHTTTLLLAVLPAFAVGHGSIVQPPPRNAIDHDLAPWNSSSVPVLPDGSPAFEPDWCPIPDAKMPRTPAGRLSGSNGQACFWFSSGCSIGCSECDGVTRGPIPSIACTNATDKHEMCARKMPVCESGIKMPTLPREARTVDTDKEDGADDDYYQYSPWRAPGSAGVIDPCGVAGGFNQSMSSYYSYGIHYTNTTHAKHGDKGTELPVRDTGTHWTAGDVVEVSWSLNANHVSTDGWNCSVE